MTCEAVINKLKNVNNITFYAEGSNGFNTPSDLYKNVDKKLQTKKLSRPKQERL